MTNETNDMPDVIYAYHSGIFVREHLEGPTKYIRADLVAAPIVSSEPTGDKAIVDGAISSVLFWASKAINEKPRGKTVPDLDWCEKTIRTALQENTAPDDSDLVKALEDTNSLLAAMYHKKRTWSEINDQIDQNNKALDGHKAKKDGSE